MSGPELITLGCRLNFAESEAMRAAAGDEDLVIINSCAVTAEAVRQARKEIRRAARRRPDARIIVTGCAAQVEPAGFAAMPEVAQVWGNAEKAAFSSAPSSQRKPGSRAAGTTHEMPAFAGMTGKVLVSDIMQVRETAPQLAASFGTRTRAFLEVQTGCDHRCTFCIIPYGRGNSRSVPAGLVIDRVAALVDAGCREVVLTGVDITSYGADLPGAPTLGLLVERVLRHVPRLERLRLSSLDSVEIDARLFDLVTGEARIMPHLHLSLQAGDDMVLKRMKRRHSRADAVRLVERLKARRPAIAIGADLIAGFPTETDAMAENSLALIDDCDIVFGHIFPYSPRPGTPAARMPQVAGADIRRRAHALREATERRRAAWLATQVGTIQQVLVERQGNRGHCENFAEVRFSSSRRTPGPMDGNADEDTGVDPFTGHVLRRDDVGSILPTRITAVADDSLIGTPL